MEYHRASPAPHIVFFASPPPAIDLVQMVESMPTDLYIVYLVRPRTVNGRLAVSLVVRVVFAHIKASVRSRGCGPTGASIFLDRLFLFQATLHHSCVVSPPPLFFQYFP